jgi:hypothetical protein
MGYWLLGYWAIRAMAMGIVPGYTVYRHDTAYSARVSTVACRLAAIYTTSIYQFHQQCDHKSLVTRLRAEGGARRKTPTRTTSFGPTDVFVGIIWPRTRQKPKFGGQRIWLTDINEGRSAE